MEQLDRDRTGQHFDYEGPPIATCIGCGEDIMDHHSWREHEQGRIHSNCRVAPLLKRFENPLSQPLGELEQEWRDRADGADSLAEEMQHTVGADAIAMVQDETPSKAVVIADLVRAQRRYDDLGPMVYTTLGRLPGVRWLIQLAVSRSRGRVEAYHEMTGVSGVVIDDGEEFLFVFDDEDTHRLCLDSLEQKLNRSPKNVSV